MNQSELKAERKKRKLTQAQFADLLGVKKGTVTAWETGQNPVPSWIKKRLDELNKVSVNPRVTITSYNKLNDIAKGKGIDVDSAVAEALEYYITKGGKVLLLFLLAHLGWHWLEGKETWLGDGIAQAWENGVKITSFLSGVIADIIGAL